MKSLPAFGILFCAPLLFFNAPEAKAAATFSPSTRKDSIGFVAVGSTKTDSITVTNTGNSTLNISNVRSSNPRFTPGPVSASLTSGTSRKFGITFSPNAGGLQTAFITFTHNGSTSPDTITSSGTGTVPAFTVNRRTIAYGYVVIATNKPDSVSVSNSGAAPLVISSVTSNSARYTVSPTSGTIQPGGKSTFTITFRPTVTGAQAANIIFTHNAPTVHDTVNVNGTGTGFSVNRRSVPFGTVPAGTGTRDSVTVTNAGALALTVSTVTSSNGVFAISPASASIPVAGSAKFYITFTPLDATPQTGNIVFVHSAASSPDTVTVSGTGTVPGISFNKKTVPFGIVPVGGNATDSVLISSTGTGALVISSITSSNGTFTVNPANATIPASQSKTFYLTFTPVTTTAQSGNIVFTHNAPSLHDTVAVSGTGGGPGFSLNRKTVPFGTVALGGNRLDSVAVTDTGAIALVISSVTSGNGTFVVNPTGATIQPAQSKTFYITFTPASTIPQSGNVVFTHNASSLHDTVTVSGTGGRPGFSLNRKTLPFGTVTVGTNRIDSVAVTDTGAVPLVISSVVSGNGTFTVNPSGATIQPAQSKTFYITFTPTGMVPQNGNVVFTHNAPSLHDTVTVTGTGGLAGFSLNRRSVAFGNILVGANSTDSVTVADTGLAPLVISNVVSSNGRFTVNPANATVQPAHAATFRITFAPQDATPQTGTLVFTHNAPGGHDTVALSGTGIATLPPPPLTSPANGSSGLAGPVTFSWGSVTGVTLYKVQVATDSLFTSIVFVDSTVPGTARQVSGLPPNTLYYWRVGTGNPAGYGAFSPAWTLSTASSGAVTGTISFSGDVSSTSYKMFGLPGVGRRTVGDILTGTQKTDWRMLRDNGKDTTYPAYYEDLAAGSPLITGEGYWLLLKNNLTIARTDSLPPLAPDGTYSIPLHSGWNMISNPFTVSVLRTAVIAANNLPSGTLFWSHDSSTRTSSGTTLEPFKGYYFDNDTASLATLKIPYPFGTSVSKLPAKAAGMSWRVELVFDSDINTDRDNYIGIAPTAGQGRNAWDQHEAPLVFDEGFLYFVRPEWDPVHSRFATDIRPALGNGQTWDFEVWNPRKRSGKITVNGVGGIPPQYQAALVDPLNSTPVDLRRTSTYTYQTSSKTMQFRLIVGTKEYVDGETSKLMPQAYDLAQNYPNPFNPSTTIGYMLPAPGYARLEILSVLGQRVRILDEGYRSAATHTVVWDGRDATGHTVSSGVYFSRLIAGENVTRTRKLLLVR